jgi:hypothetical protein
MLVRYEDLVEDLDRALGRVFRFAGLDDHTPGRRAGEHAGEAASGSAPEWLPRSGVNEHYFERWQRRKRNPGKRAYLGLAEARYERDARAFGYSLRRLSVFPPANPLVARLLDAAG